MAFASLFKGRETAAESESALASPVDLVVEAESLKAELAKLPIAGSQLVKYGLEADRLREALADFRKKKQPAKYTSLLEDAQTLLREIQSAIRSYEAAPSLEAEHVLEEYEVAGASLKKETKERGRKNQDALLIDSQTDVFGVFDGLGGAASGEKASQSAASSIRTSFAEFPATKNIEVMKNWMAESLKEASRRIRAESMGDGRGTTASVIKLWEGADGRRKAIVGNVGDSRVYVYRNRTKTLEQVTLDDSSVLSTDPATARSVRRMFAPDIEGVENELFEQLHLFLKREGYSEDEIFDAAPKTESEARALQESLNQAATDEDFDALSPYAKFYFRFNNLVSQSLGSDEEIAPRVTAVDVEDEDIFLIDSDGIHDNLPNARIKEIVASGKHPDGIAHALANEAQLASHAYDLRAKPDDMTAVVVRMPAGRKNMRAAA